MTKNARSWPAISCGEMRPNCERLSHLPRGRKRLRCVRGGVYLQAAITIAIVLSAVYDSKVGLPASVAVILAGLGLLVSGVLLIVAFVRCCIVSGLSANSLLEFLVTVVLAVMTLYALTVFVR